MSPRKIMVTFMWNLLMLGKWLLSWGNTGRRLAQLGSHKMGWLSMGIPPGWFSRLAPLQGCPMSQLAWQCSVKLSGVSDRREWEAPPGSQSELLRLAQSVSVLQCLDVDGCWCTFDIFWHFEFWHILSYFDNFWYIVTVFEAINVSLHYLERVIVALHARSKGNQAKCRPRISAHFS